MLEDEVENFIRHTKELIIMIKQMWQSDSTHDDVVDKACEIEKKIPDLESLIVVNYQGSGPGK